ncbi:hypothetical protein HK098_006434 [Nowakowskiella sp. JEL0407]|nr:hypothetical protein HK098_006434 [Nowakowskiella sp. JEL0407]
MYLSPNSPNPAEKTGALDLLALNNLTALYDTLVKPKFAKPASANITENLLKNPTTATPSALNPVSLFPKPVSEHVSDSTQIEQSYSNYLKDIIGKKVFKKDRGLRDLVYGPQKNAHVPITAFDKNTLKQSFTLQDTGRPLDGFQVSELIEEYGLNDSKFALTESTTSDAQNLGITPVFQPKVTIKIDMSVVGNASSIPSSPTKKKEKKKKRKHENGEEGTVDGEKKKKKKKKDKDDSEKDEKIDIISV